MLLALAEKLCAVARGETSQFRQHAGGRSSISRLFSRDDRCAWFLHRRGGMIADRFVKENTIIGIFNYCTRRCERCPFTERCTLYLTARDYERRHPDATWQDQVHDSFAKT